MQRVAILLALTSLFFVGAQAQTAVSWNGGNGNWNTPGDWSGGVVPNNGGGKTYDVTIGNGTAETVTLNLGVTVSDLTLGTSATLQSAAGDSLTIASGGTLTNSGIINFNTTGSNITVANGSLVNNGTLNLEAAGETLNVTGTTTNAAGASIQIEGGSAATFTGNVTNSGTFQTGFSGGSNTVTVSGTFTNNAGATLDTASAGDVININALNNSGTLTVATGSTLTITGGGNGVTDVVAGSTYNVNGSFNVKNGSTTSSAFAKLGSIEGTLSLNNAQAIAITPGSGTLSIGNTGNLGVQGGTSLMLTGNLTNSGAFSTGFSGGNNTVSVSGTFTNNSGASVNLDGSGDVLNVNALNNSGSLTINSGSTLNITGGGQGVTDVVAGSTLTVDGALNVKNGGTSSNGLGNLTTVAGTLSLNDGLTNNITPNGGTLSIVSGGQLNLSDGAVSATTLSVTGNVNNSGNFSTGFSGGTNTVNVTKTFTNATGGVVILYGSADVLNVNALSNSGTLTIDSGAALNITGGGQGITDVVAGSSITLAGSLNVINNHVSSSALGHLTSVEGALTLNNGQNNAMTPSSGTLTIASGGQLNLSDGISTTTTLSLTGNVSNSGNFSTGFSGGTNTVNVSGTFTNNIGGTLFIYGGGGVGTGTDVVNIPTLTNAGTVTLLGTGSTLDITGTGTLNNSGSINLTEGTLKFAGSSANLTGGGAVTLGNGSGSETATIQVGSNDTGTLTNTSDTITGFGNIGNGTLTLINKGTINANGQVSSGALTVQPGSGAMTNSGMLEASNQGTLILKGTYNNTGGTIEALGGNGATGVSTVQLTAGTVVNGGTLTTTTAGTNSGLIEGTGAVTLNGITNSGTYAVNSGTTTTLLGIIANSGNITLTNSTLSLGNGVTLTGKGTIVLSNSSTNLITASTGGLTLTNANTIEGSGTIQNMGIVNTGIISATQSTPLIVLPSSAGLNNKGTLSVSAGDTMQIGTSAGGALLNFSGTTLTGGTYTVSGTLEFGANGTSVVTDAANITLTGAAANITDLAGHSVLTNLATVTSAGSFTIGNGANFTTAGSFTNDGKLTVNSGSTFKVTGSLTNFSGSTLTGGTYTVSGKLDFAGANIVTDAANLTISGSGELINTTNGGNGLKNLATIASSGSLTLSGKANLTTAGNLTNNGRLTVSSGSTLTVTNNLTNFNSATNTLSNGNYTIGGTLEFTGANIVNNAATLTISGSSAKILNGTANGLANFANNTGSFTLTANGSLTTASTAFTNSGALTVASGSTLSVGGNNTYTQSAGTTTIDGTLSAGGTGITVTGGTIQGVGKLNTSVTVGGSGTSPNISSGDSGKAGLLVITGTYTQLSSASMNAFIGGATVGTQYSQLQVSNSATLAGTLSVALASGFTPTVGSTFTVLTASSISGTFSNSTIAINGSEHFNVSYTSTGVVLTVASGAAPQSGSTGGSKLVAGLQPRQPVIINRFRRSASGNRIFARSGALMAGSSNIRPTNIRVANHDAANQLLRSAPIAGFARAILQKPSTVKARPLAPTLSSFAAKNNWINPAQAIAPARSVVSPAAQRFPVRVISPVLPRMGR